MGLEFRLIAEDESGSCMISRRDAGTLLEAGKRTNCFSIHWFACRENQQKYTESTRKNQILKLLLKSKSIQGDSFGNEREH